MNINCVEYKVIKEKVFIKTCRAQDTKFQKIIKVLNKKYYEHVKHYNAGFTRTIKNS
jgi:hypothetical protein